MDPTGIDVVDVMCVSDSAVCLLSATDSAASGDSLSEKVQTP